MLEDRARCRDQPAGRARAKAGAGLGSIRKTSGWVPTWAALVTEWRARNVTELALNPRASPGSCVARQGARCLQSEGADERRWG